MGNGSLVIDQRLFFIYIEHPVYYQSKQMASNRQLLKWGRLKEASQLPRFWN